MRFDLERVAINRHGGTGVRQGPQYYLELPATWDAELKRHPSRGKVSVRFRGESGRLGAPLKGRGWRIQKTRSPDLYSAAGKWANGQRRLWARLVRDPASGLAEVELLGEVPRGFNASKASAGGRRVASGVAFGESGARVLADLHPDGGLAAWESLSYPDVNSEISDPRRRVWREVQARRGQADFRARLMAVFEGTCCMTGCALEPVLEAAHIDPYASGGDMAVDNGLLLRADVHLLFDMGLVAVNASLRIVHHPDVVAPHLASLQLCEAVRPPKGVDRKAWLGRLRRHFEWAGL